jgi:hypothetical protein
VDRVSAVCRSRAWGIGAGSFRHNADLGLAGCAYNAVAARATHGVWAGEILPGDKPAELEPIYARLLARYERRRTAELGGTPPIAVPGSQARRRHRNAAKFLCTPRIFDIAAQFDRRGCMVRRLALSISDVIELSGHSRPFSPGLTWSLSCWHMAPLVWT